MITINNPVQAKEILLELIKQLEKYKNPKLSITLNIEEKKGTWANDNWKETEK